MEIQGRGKYTACAAAQSRSKNYPHHRRDYKKVSNITQQLCKILDTVKVKHLRLVILNSITVDCREGKTDLMKTRTYARLYIVRHGGGEYNITYECE